MTTVLVIGDYRQSLTIARALHRRGDRVIAMIAARGESYLRRSLAVTEHWRTGIRIGQPGFWQAFEAALVRYEPDVVFPVGDDEIAWFSEPHKDSCVPLASVDSDTARVCQDKPSLLALATNLEVAHARSEVVGEAGSLGRAAEQVGFPLIVKPTTSTRRLLGRKGIVCRSQTDLDSSLRKWPDAHKSLIVERFIQGSRHNLYFAAECGEVKGLVEVEILRTDTLDGTGYAVDGITVRPRPDLVAATEAIVAELKYHGVGCSQFIVSPSRKTSLLELNPRLGANYVVADRAGLNLANLAVDLALERRIAPVSPTEIGVRYAWTTGDLIGLANELRQTEIGIGGAIQWLGRTFRSAFAARVHVTWKLRDPLPTLNILWRWIARLVVRSVFRRRA